MLPSNNIEFKLTDVQITNDNQLLARLVVTVDNKRIENNHYLIAVPEGITITLPIEAEKEY